MPAIVVGEGEQRCGDWHSPSSPAPPPSGQPKSNSGGQRFATAPHLLDRLEPPERATPLGATESARSCLSGSAADTHRPADHAITAYQEILSLRADHIDGDLLLIDGVGPGYNPRARATKLRAGTPEG